MPSKNSTRSLNEKPTKAQAAEKLRGVWQADEALVNDQRDGRSVPYMLRYSEREVCMNLIGFAGKAQAGKTTAAKFLADQGFQTVSFAAGVKKESAWFLVTFGVPFMRKHLYGTKEEKEELLGMFNYRAAVEAMPEFREFIDQRGISSSIVGSLVRFTGRQLLQWWGTDYRKKQNPDYWAEKTITKVEKLLEAGEKVAIDDVRFPSEAATILDMGGLVCYVDRAGGPQIAENTHESETALDGYDRFSCVISNCGTLGEFGAMVEEVVR